MKEPMIEATGASPDDMYERHSVGYDTLVGSRLYNRVVWGADTRDYAAFARHAVASAPGPLLEVAAGSCLFTADAYLGSDRTIVLTDRSSGMLREAARRLTLDGVLRPGTRHVQADAFDLPFEAGEFDTALCLGFLHLVERPGDLIDRLQRLLAPGGRVFLTSLVADTPFGSRYLRFLHSRGVVAEPRTADELADLTGVSVRRRGAMAYLEVPATR